MQTNKVIFQDNDAGEISDAQMELIALQLNDIAPGAGSTTSFEVFDKLADISIIGLSIVAILFLTPFIYQVAQTLNRKINDGL